MSTKPSGQAPSGLKQKLALFDLRQMMPEQLLPVVQSGNSNLYANAGLTALVPLLVQLDGIGNTPVYWALCSWLSIIVSVIVNRAVYRNGAFWPGVMPAAWILAASNCLRGLVWGVGFALMMPHASPLGQLILGWMLAGIMCGGAFSAWSHPLAAVGFSGLAGLGGFIGMRGVPELGQTYMPYATLLMFGLLTRVVLANVVVLRHSALAERNVAAQNELIGLLLRDFEESAGDWLWETDSSGRLTRGADRFAAALQLDASNFMASPLIDVLDRHGATKAGLRDLEDSLKQNEAFSGLVVECEAMQGRTYISLSAKPMFDATGQGKGWRGVASDVTQQKLADLKVRKLALFDALTELPNRSNFYEQLKALITERRRGPSWVLYLDLDGFKGVNDTLGHATGDALLHDVADRFSRCLGRRDVVARIGGDEFAAIVRGSRNHVDQVCRRLLRSLNMPIQTDGNLIAVGVSIGATCVTADICHPDEVMRRADVALYRAKENGRGQVLFYDADMDRAEQQRRELQLSLRLAMSRNELEIHYQPIHDIRTGEMIAAEALLRWNRGELGFVPPNEFIPLAEDSGLIGDIGAWVLQQACQQAMEWPRHVRVAINVSPLQFRSHRILSDVSRALASSGLPASRLELEITESALIDNVELTSRLLADLKILGVRLALDDFGTGYSSLSHLHQFQFDKIKIDRSFVQSYRKRRQSAAVVHAVAHLARDLDIVITAEGVETADHLRDMQAVGCGQAQGFLFGAALPASMLDFVRRTKGWARTVA